MIYKKKLFLFDIDGVIRLGDAVIDGAIELCEQISKMGGKSIFITNNSTKSESSYVQTFQRYGFKDVDESNFVTALTVTKKFLLKNYYNKLIYAWGTESFVGELRKCGLNITTDKSIKDICAVVVGYNSELTFQNLCDVCEVLQTTNAEYYATNADWICPVLFGFIPDCGGICKLIELATGKMPIFLGKPAPDMIDIAMLDNPSFKKEEVVVIGDRLYTDIACGINAGVDTCVVFTGEAKPADMPSAEFVPTYQYKSVKEICEDLKNCNNFNELC